MLLFIYKMRTKRQHKENVDERYHFHTEPDATCLGLMLAACEHLVVAEQPFPTSRITQYFILLLIKRGSKPLVVGKDYVRLKANDVILLHPDSAWAYGAGDQWDWEEYSILFMGELPYRHAHELPRQPVSSPILKHKLHDLEVLFNRLRSGFHPTQRLAALTVEILAELTCLTRTPHQAPAASNLDQILLAIQSHPNKAWDYRQLARQASISYALFRRRFKELTGYSPHRYVNQLRMNRACLLLQQGMSVKETAYAIGMKDAYHFSRLFKQVYAEPPVDYQKRVFKKAAR